MADSRDENQSQSAEGMDEKDGTVDCELVRWHLWAVDFPYVFEIVWSL